MDGYHHITMYVLPGDAIIWGHEDEAIRHVCEEQRPLQRQQVAIEQQYDHF